MITGTMIVITRITIVITKIAHHDHGVQYPPEWGMAAGS